MTEDQRNRTKREKHNNVDLASMLFLPNAWHVILIFQFSVWIEKLEMPTNSELYIPILGILEILMESAAKHNFFCYFSGVFSNYGHICVSLVSLNDGRGVVFF